jgi:hypothetical protein
VRDPVMPWRINAMNERVLLKVWITKYALSQGIFELCAQTRSIDGLISDPLDSLQIYHGEGREWHRTKECAVVAQEANRQPRKTEIRLGMTM